MSEEKTIPFCIVESMLDRNALTIKRLWILCILLIVLLVGTNAMWIWYENSFEEIVVTQENTDGYNNFIGNDGDINN